MFRGMFGNPVLNRSNEKDRQREGGYFAIPLQREHEGAEHFHDTYIETILLALVVGVLSLLVASVAALFGAELTRDVAGFVALGMFVAIVYLCVDRVSVSRRVSLDVHGDRQIERDTFQSTENMYSVALAHYLRFKDGQAYDIEQLRLFAKFQQDLLANNSNSFDYKEK